MSVPKFSAPSLSIHAELKNRVNSYFKNNEVESHGTNHLYWKAGILLSSYLFIYISVVFFTPAWYIAIPECLFLGILTAGIGFNVMHDGSHGSFSKHPKLNNLAAKSIEMLGASSFMWNMKHNVVHHAFTNIHEVDDDINAGPLLRMCDSQKKYKIHRYQHLYFWFLYSLLHMFWIFFTDYKKYFTNKVGEVPLKKLTTKDHIMFWGAKVFYVVAYVVLPITLCGFVPWLVGFLCYAMVSGFVLSIVFQLAHVIEETQFPIATQPANKIEDEWALHQLKTTANFATRNKFITWWVGGLNFQVEHHLFPKISHVHYPTISKIVKQTCEDLGVPYLEHRRMASAIASHVSHLKKMGTA